MEKLLSVTAGRQPPEQAVFKDAQLDKQLSTLANRKSPAVKVAQINILPTADLL